MDKKIVYVPEIKIGFENTNYFSNLLRIINTLHSHNILETIFERNNSPASGYIVADTIYQQRLDSEYEYFVISITYDNNNTDNGVRLIFRIDNLYMQGFIISNHCEDDNQYYHFSDSDLTEISGGIERYSSINLGFSSHYTTLWTQNFQNINIDWSRIVHAFESIRNYSVTNPNPEIRNNLALVILITSESLRFRRIFQLISNISQNYSASFNWSHIQPIVNNWGSFSRIVLDLLVSITNVRNNAKLLSQLGIMIVLDKIRQISNYNKRHLLSDEFKKYNELKTEIDKIKGKITAIKILDENTKGGNLKAGDIYVGTENGVYLIHGENQVHRFLKLDFPIKDIILDGKGSAYIINEESEIYHLDLYGWGSEKTNMKSCDLNKELILYYNQNKSEEIIINDWYDTPNNKLVFKTFNVLKYDPVNKYNKIEFLGSDNNFKLTRTSWGEEPYSSDKKLNQFNGQDYRKIITNLGEIKNNWDNDDIFCWSRLQSFSEKWRGASIEGSQSFALNYYREHRNGNFYLQFLVRQYATCWHSSIGGSQFMGVGNAIRLYNDDLSTSLTNEFIKSINHEQHLAIDNKPNFSTSNITSL